MNTKIIQKAVSQLGVKEIVGPQHNPTIVNYAKSIGATWVNDDETPWCAIFVQWCLKECGFKYSSSALARSFEKYGEEQKNPSPGDIVVFWRKSPTAGTGHVGFFMGYAQDGNIFVLGGNQGNQVSISKYPKSNLIGFRKIGNEVERNVNFESDVV